MELYGYADPQSIPPTVEVDNPAGGVLQVDLQVMPIFRAESEAALMTIKFSDTLTDDAGEDVEAEAVAERIEQTLVESCDFVPSGPDTGVQDLFARVISNEWHGGMASALYAFTSTGAIRDDLAAEIEDTIGSARRWSDETEVARLQQLLAYVQTEGERGPQPGWADLVW